MTNQPRERILPGGNLHLPEDRTLKRSATAKTYAFFFPLMLYATSIHLL